MPLTLSIVPAASLLPRAQRVARGDHDLVATGPCAALLHLLPVLVWGGGAAPAGESIVTPEALAAYARTGKDDAVLAVRVSKWDESLLMTTRRTDITSTVRTQLPAVDDVMANKTKPCNKDRDNNYCHVGMLK